jgi:hypothetical protein
VALLDQKGREIDLSQFKKGPAPIRGEAFAPHWAGDWDRKFVTFPGGGVVQFDLSKLTIADFRTMRDHYQINATLAVLTFMMHQMDWKIESTSKKVETALTENISAIWVHLIRAISQSFWAGYSPNVLQWENDGLSSKIVLTKIKDLIPETSWVNWKEVDGYAPPEYQTKPKIKVYDGIKIWGQNWPTPVDNSFWYPLMMENGDYYGRKLLRPAFISWYFSILIHLFSNRYFERFGEPVPVGRASYEDEITVRQSDGSTQRVLGADLMVQVLQNLRNRSVVVLPNDRSMIGTHGGGNAIAYDYDIEYLESQMRGADFERYLMRLDEEISLSLFTPLLILRTADVGSYNLGSTHWNMYLNMLNAIAGDAKYYIDNFILSRMVDHNFGVTAPRAQIVFRKMGDDRKELILAMLQAMVGKGTVKPDVNEIGDIAGLTITEVKQVLASNDPNNPQDGPPNQPPSKTGTPPKKGTGSGSSGGSKKTANANRVVGEIATRVGTQVAKFIKDSTEGASFDPSFGYDKQLAAALSLDGVENAESVVERTYRAGKAFLTDLPRDYMRDLGVSGVTDIVVKLMSSKFEEYV